MRQVYLFVTLVAIVLGFTAAAAAAGSGERALVREINRVRAQYGLRPLVSDVRLARAARKHSISMLRQGELEHGNVRARLHRQGIRPAVYGENIAWVAGRGWARWVVRHWLGSPIHRAVLLYPSFRRIGIAAVPGRFEGQRGARVVTADFAAP